MTFAVRPVGMAPKRWEYRGVGAASSGATLGFPETAQAGDLAVVVYCHSAGSRSLPSGWTWLYSGSSIPRHCYKVCSGGESSVSKPNDSTGVGSVMLFRPSGGAIRLDDSRFSEPPSTAGVTAASSSLVVVVTATAAAASFTASVAPADYTSTVNVTGGPSLGAGFAPLASGAFESFRLDASSGTIRQVVALFGL